MRIRRIIYLALVAFLIIFLFSIDNNLSGLRSPMPINLQMTDIVEEFQDLPGTEDSKYNSLYFPQDFSGQAGDIFYGVRDKKVYKYKLETVEDKSGVSLLYEYQEIYDNISLPQDKFQIFDL